MARSRTSRSSRVNRSRPEPPSPSSADSLELRPLRRDDLQAASALSFEANDVLEGQTDEARAFMASVTIVRTDLEERIDESVLVGAWIEGRLAGIVNYVAGPRDPYAEFSGEDEAGVRGLAVGIGWQRKGVGQSLVTYCIERARAEGKARLVLHTTPWMHAAQRLYPRLGFRRAPEMDFSPAPGIPLIGYTLDLEPEEG